MQSSPLMKATFSDGLRYACSMRRGEHAAPFLVLNPNPPPSPVPCPQQKLNKVPSRSERTLNPFHRNCKLGLPPKTPFARPGLHPLPPPRGLLGISALAWGRASAGSCRGRSKVLASVAGSCAPAPAHSRRALHEVLGLRMF